MTMVLEWIKSNIFIVIFVLIILVALVAAPIFSGSMNEEVKQKAEARARKLNELNQVTNTSIELEIPGGEAFSETGVINQKLVDEYAALTGRLSEDAAKVHLRALEHNRKGREVLTPNLFPEPPQELRQTLPRQFHRQLVTAYENMLNEADAGSPPPTQSVKEEIIRREAQFIPSMFNKNSREELNEAELDVLAEELAKARLLAYREKASTVGMYVSQSVLPIPSLGEQEQPPLASLFNWQWEYWVTQDILRALAEANEQAENVLDAPVKRVLLLSILDNPAAGLVDANQSASGQQGSSFGGRSRRSQGSSGGNSGSASTARQADPAVEAPLNYNTSFTGRQSNPLYDVREVELVLVIETSQLPRILDELARQNFITVIDLDMVQRDRRADAASGYVYGPKAISTVSMLLETVWLREWTGPFMPASLKTKLGVAAEQSSSPQT